MYTFYRLIKTHQPHIKYLQPIKFNVFKFVSTLFNYYSINVLMNYIDFLKIDLFSLDTPSFYQNMYVFVSSSVAVFFISIIFTYFFLKEHVC